MHATPELDPIPFDPVPTGSTRHDGWTPARQRAFIDALGTCRLLAGAARAVGTSPKSADRLRDRDGADSFRAAWDVALDQGRDTAMTRAMHGVAEPVFRGGLQLGERRPYDNRLLIAALRKREPATKDGAAALAAFLGSSQSVGDMP